MLSDKALTDRHKIFGRGNLMIQNVKAEDAGIYQCFIKNGRYKQHHSAMLSVHSKWGVLAPFFRSQH